MKTIPKKQLISLIKVFLHETVSDKEMSEIFENYGDDCKDNMELLEENQNRAEVLKWVASN